MIKNKHFFKLFFSLVLSILFGLLDCSSVRAESFEKSASILLLIKHLDTFKDQLLIQPDQEKYWENYKNSVLNNAINNENLVKDEQLKSNLTAIDYLKIKAKHIDIFAQAFHRITDNFEVLYQHLTPQQKLSADTYFKNLTK